MPVIKEVIDHLQKKYKKNDTIAYFIFDRNDIIQRAKMFNAEFENPEDSYQGYVKGVKSNIALHDQQADKLNYLISKRTSITYVIVNAIRMGLHITNDSLDNVINQQCLWRVLHLEFPRLLVIFSIPKAQQ